MLTGPAARVRRGFLDEPFDHLAVALVPGRDNGSSRVGRDRRGDLRPPLAEADQW